MWGDTINHNWTNTRGNGCELKSYEGRTSDYYEYKFQNSNQHPVENIRVDSDTRVWVNPQQLQVIIFKLGEEIMISCSNLESFRAELAALREVDRIH